VKISECSNYSEEEKQVVELQYQLLEAKEHRSLKEKRRKRRIAEESSTFQGRISQKRLVFPQNKRQKEKEKSLLKSLIKLIEKIWKINLCKLD
jgi:hypothetical protein